MRKKWTTDTLVGAPSELREQPIYDFPSRDATSPGRAEFWRPLATEADFIWFRGLQLKRN